MRSRVSRLAVLVAGVAGVAAPAAAVPRFALRNAAPCATCHVNPTGAGMRNEYGRQAFEMHRLAFPPIDRLLDPAPDPASALPLGPVTLGADLRTAYVWVEELTDRAGGPTNTPIDGFFAMQGDLYMRARLGRFFDAYLDKGLTGGYETFLLGRFGEWAYAKVGRFVPPYGLRLDNHRTTIREGLTLDATARDTGIEVGTARGGGPVQAAVMFARPSLSPDRTAPGTWGVSGFASLTRAVGPVRALVGASAARRPEQAAPAAALGALTLDVTQGLHETMAGGFAGLSLGRFAWMGEADLVLTRENAPDDTRTIHTVVAYQELAFLAVQGIEVGGTFEWQEPDLDVASGASWRTGGFVEFFPIPFFEFRPMYRHTEAPGMGADGEDEVTVMFHGFF